MTLREVVFGAALLLSGTLITVGVYRLSVAAALIVAGVLVALFAWLVLSE